MLNDGESLLAAHFSDLHYSPGHLAEADRCFGFAVEDAIASRCQVAVVSGDSTDHRLDAHTPALSALARRIHQLSAHLPVIMLQGTFSHEPPGTLDLFRLIGASYPVYVADRIHQVALVGGAFFPSDGAIFSQVEMDRLLTQHGLPDVVFTCVPTVNKAVLAAAAGVANAATAVGNHLADYLAAAGAVNRQWRSQGVRTIGVSHGTVNGCQTEHGVPMAGLDHEFTIGALFEASCDAFMLGHIHRAQQWEREGRVVAYPGSIGRFHYGEIGAKGYLQWQVSPGEAVATQVKTPASEAVCIDFDGPPDMAKLAEIAADAAHKYVRVRWTVNEEHRQLVDREAIEAVFAASAEVKLEARVLPAVRSRAEGISRAATLSEKVGRWCELTGVDANPLLDNLSMLENLDAQAIADQVLAGLAETSIPVTQEVRVVEAAALPFIAKLSELDLDETAVAPEATSALLESLAEPVAPIATAAAPMNWLTDDLFA
ncbi:MULTISPECIES: metallophosphatase family protein [unclassified Cupriavidus]|uniref:metallophosphoesterase family protein n=1 Tax=unclassified Cupriavidus TaxID=2640874 RepID=UPI0010F68FE9|nr:MULTISPECIES: metallophosphatase family protein [unclassified Cupriavidus]MWL91986.1 metallophosphatase family protein [Cupriavidus sp. SW-Y-13]